MIYENASVTMMVVLAYNGIKYLYNITYLKLCHRVELFHLLVGLHPFLLKKQVFWREKACSQMNKINNKVRMLLGLIFNKLHYRETRGAKNYIM